MNTNKIALFILVTFCISWLIWLPNVLSHNFNVGWGPSDSLHLLGGLGPFLGAVVTTYLFDKKRGLKFFFKNKLFALPKAKWLVIGFGMPVLFFIIPYVYFGITKGNWLNISRLGLNDKLPVTNTLLIWLIWCFFYGIGEEGGWRGFLLPEITKKYH